MRILVYEFASGGGFSGRNVPASLAREGLAMLSALVTDLSLMRHHDIVTTLDRRFNLVAPPGVKVVPVSPGDGRPSLDKLIASADAVWLIAPETDRCLERLAACVERHGRQLLGSGALAIRRASNKSALPRLLAAHNLPYPQTRILRPGAGSLDAKTAARQVGYPLIVKPARGAGCEGVSLVRAPGALRQAIDAARALGRRGPVLLQQYVQGVPASVSLLADGRRAVALTVNRQVLRGSTTFSYRGGTTPFDHAQADRAVDAALRTCAAFPGLRGYVGVDLILTRSDAFVIEINPRLTTAYLGVRAVIDGNVAGMAIGACEGILPAAPMVHGTVRFTASGGVSAA
ncbi:MAG TPA: ATP-grasp domain-containing protein [Vicinamibacterales bacterium]|jgi:predicted ATP-grasp superfamily ATP-dependent carboligase|nr:ATP-grasp domain-containing protein [Vicinamibacterales bacterium]